MNARKKRLIIVLIVLVCISAVISVLFATDIRYRIAAKTGAFYPSPQKIDTVSDVEAMWRVSFPEGSYIEDQFAKKDGGIPANLMYVKYKPYYYEVRVAIPLEKTEDFLESVRSGYNDDTYDSFGRKDELGYFPEIISDMEGKGLSYSFSHIEDCPPNGEAIICIHRSIYIFEEDDTAVVYLSM